MAETNGPPPKLLYCRCAFADVVPADVKANVLEGLCRSGQAFEAVADLCEASAREDPLLSELAASARHDGGLVVAACYERAVRGLFEAAGAKLPKENVAVLNMRVQPADDIVPLMVRGRLDQVPPEAPQEDP